VVESDWHSGQSPGCQLREPRPEGQRRSGRAPKPL